MKTRIYIDGYNFYYGCLKGTDYKWLDLIWLFEKYILPRSGEGLAVLHEIDGIKYFTAEITIKAAKDPNSVNDQRAYHQALYLHNKKQLTTIKGTYSVETVLLPKVEVSANGGEKEPKDSSRVKVWKLEEKQSDVNVALEAVYDVLTDSSIEQVIFVTNDTDIVPALRKIKEHNDKKERSTITIGLVVPLREDNQRRRANKSLTDLADWTVHDIKNVELLNSQLPSRISGKKSAAFKPISWFKYSAQVEEIVKILAHPEVLKSVPRAWRWLSDPAPEVEWLPKLAKNPAELLDCEQGIKDVLQHVKAFAEYKKK